MSLTPQVSCSSWVTGLCSIGITVDPVDDSALLVARSLLSCLQFFKYLGVILSSDLTFSQHIESTCSKASRPIVSQRFYNNVNIGTLLQLYLSLVRPHLEYASPMWNLYKQKHIKHLENVEKFALYGNQVLGLWLPGPSIDG